MGIAASLVAPATARIRIAHITPSTNTILEPITCAINHALADRVSHHFSRLRVTQIAIGDTSDTQFDPAPMLSCAELLADSEPDLIVWNGTAGSWLGLEHDLDLVERIREHTGIPATTSTLALHAAFQACDARRIGLAVPYDGPVTEGIIAEYARHGRHVVSHARLNQTVNYEFGCNSAADLRALLHEADSPDAQCIAVVCTNLAATGLATEMERTLGKPILDSIAVTFWQACRLTGLDVAIEDWGQLLAGKLTNPQHPDV